ncbi:hypothetical protein EGM88_12195 [Aureibaculum marinum]|uniref:DUF7847 domain-containing protein n=1 Tax=Aureibaculum marinum TaxID=2487930 RepID=A0A3N4NDV8_9FLAO|nr:glycerophosphoryl diester phosphodiesterase membrane domain-containing protein [Aureibaculum marinum]RPD94494.1 hypothetical protein EGM88_12195 [Aureibaculum marinum]
MQNYNFIEFKKERDLGAIINDTFKFIRENWKPYFGAIIKIAGPFILIGSILMVLFFSYYLGVVGEVAGMNQSSNPDDVFGLIGPMFGWIGLLAIVLILVFIIVSLTSLFYIKSYISNDGNVNFDDVKSNTFQNIWKYLGLGILVALMIGFGLILCYLPGIYLWVVLSLSTSIMVFENKSVGDSISHSFTLIKGQWWNTFGVLLVIGILVNILGYAFSVPALLYQLIGQGTMLGSDDPTEVFNIFKDPIYIGLNVLSYIGKFVLSSITLISAVFIYYDLNEQKNLTGTIEKIDSLGQ